MTQNNTARKSQLSSGTRGIHLVVSNRIMVQWPEEMPKPYASEVSESSRKVEMLALAAAAIAAPAVWIGHAILCWMQAH